MQNRSTTSRDRSRIVDFPSILVREESHAQMRFRTAMGIALRRPVQSPLIASLDNDIPALKLDGDQLHRCFEHCSTRRTP
jgi:hypothetical protein